MFKYIRHPEIIGAVSKYICFLILAQQSKFYIAAGLVNLFMVWSEVKMRNSKLATKEGGKKYLEETNAMIPKYFKQDILNIAFIIVFCGFLYLDYSVGGYITKLNRGVPGVPVRQAGSDL